MIKKIEILKGDAFFDISNNNVDVVIEMVDGKTYISTFYTIDNIKTLMSNWKNSGEHDAGSHFWAKDSVLVDSLADENIIRVINYLVDSNEIYEFYAYNNEC